MKIVSRIYRFIRYNNEKKLSLYCWFYAAKYRIQMLYSDTKKLQKKWGEAGKESPDDATLEEYQYAKKIAYCVNEVCGKTSWESKCLVRALSAQSLLKKKGIQTTLYLGCKEQDGKMVAHAWLRLGRFYVTGGNGSADGYGVVAKFLA